MIGRPQDSLDIWLPKGRVEAALREVLKENEAPIELDSGGVYVPTETQLEVVARSLHCYEFEIGFGQHLRALVAVGGVKVAEHGAVEARICFASLYFNLSAELITLEFSENMP